MNHLKLSKEEISIENVSNLIADEECGACSIFAGTTRNNFEGKRVISLEYEAYESMALKEMTKICSDIRAQWTTVKHIVIYHRLGVVPTCEASVVIAASSPHRAAALESVAFAIDQLKSRVPIWKKEIYEDGAVPLWKKNKECPWPSAYEASPHSSKTFDFTSCKIDHSSETIPEKLVQIGVDDDELKRRVYCFVKKKRIEINKNNLTDFMLSANSYSNTEKSKDSCARTQSVIVKQDHSNCHLKVRRIDNSAGPQIRPNYILQLTKLMGLNDTVAPRYAKSSSQLLNIRLNTIEEHLNIDGTESKNVLHRIKNIENRIILLESISPEYQHFFTHLKRNNFEAKSKIKPTRKIYRSAELSDVIKNLNN